MSHTLATPGANPGTGPGAIPPATRRASHARFIRSQLRDYGMGLSLLVIMAFFDFMTGGTLLRPLNLTNLVLQNSYIVVMALGMLLVIVSGHIDLSVGSVAGFIGAVAGVLMVNEGMNFVFASLICLAIGGLIGAAQGYWIAYFKIPSFIVTLAGMLVFKGLSLVMLAGMSVGPFDVAFQRLSSGFIPEMLPKLGMYLPTTVILGTLIALGLVWLAWRARMRSVKHGIEVEPVGLFALRAGGVAAVLVAFCVLIAGYRGMPNVLIIMIALIGLYGFVTSRTTIGRQIYAVGGNVRAARLSGIRTEKLTFLTFVNMGVLAALGGLVFAARLNMATPKAGQGFELDVIAACFIGGASAYGGVGKVGGAVIGALIMGVMNNGMSILGIGIDWQQVLKGLVLLGAVCLDVYQQRK